MLSADVLISCTTPRHFVTMFPSDSRRAPISSRLVTFTSTVRSPSASLLATFTPSSRDLVIILTVMNVPAAMRPMMTMEMTMKTILALAVSRVRSLKRVSIRSSLSLTSCLKRLSMVFDMVLVCSDHMADASSFFPSIANVASFTLCSLPLPSCSLIFARRPSNSARVFGSFTLAMTPSIFLIASP